MHILVVEDEPKIANSIQKGLEQEHWVVDVAHDGEEGYDLASMRIYDVIIMDWMLPKNDGAQVSQQLRKDGIHTPILMLTAKSQIDDKVSGLERGADDYLTKPFAFEELVARIRALTRRPSQIESEVVEIENLQLNLTSQSVKRNNTLITLTKKEYVLLEYLAKNAHRVITKSELMERVWSYEADILPNTVEVYMGYLRKKIDTAFPNEKPLLHTIRGFGYQLGE